jgi:hypothetical protein
MEDNTKGGPPLKVADWAAQIFFGAGTDEVSQRAAIRRMLLGAVVYALLVPLMFILAFGEVGPLGWGMTVFFVAYCLLAAVGLYFLPRRDYHSMVPLRGGLADRIGAFWLVCCAFGPLLGWIVTEVFPLTPASWRWLYALRLLLAGGLPVLTALPLIRYARGKAALVALPLLLIVTMLPIWSVVNVSRDLRDGPIVQEVSASGTPHLYLPHTGRPLWSAR